jgi:protein TonB
VALTVIHKDNRLPAWLGISIFLHLAIAWLLADHFIVVEVDPGPPDAISVQVSLMPSASTASAVPPATPAHTEADTLQPLAPPLAPKTAQPAKPSPTDAHWPVAEPQKSVTEPTNKGIAVPDEPLPATGASDESMRQTIARQETNAARYSQDASRNSGSQDHAEARYVAEIRARIQAEKRYPSLARRRSITGRVVVRLKIAEDGALESIHIANKPHRILKKATQSAIRRASPFPAPPGGAKTIEFAVDYDLVGS